MILVTNYSEINSTLLSPLHSLLIGEQTPTICIHFPDMFLRWPLVVKLERIQIHGNFIGKNLTGPLPFPIVGKTTVFDPLPIVLGGVFCLCPQLGSLVLNTMSYFYNNTRLHSRSTHYNILLAIPLGTFSAYLAKWSWLSDFIF